MRTLWIAAAASAAALLAGALAPMSPAEKAIEAARKQIANKPDHAAYYTTLAMAYARRARETSDVAYYDKAEQAVRKATEIAPGNFGAMKVQTWLMLGRHDFARALEAATALNKRMPDDIAVYGFLADANVELGNYKDAVAAAQWMLDLRPGNSPGLVRASYLRELHGDIAGALDLMQQVLDATPLHENEERAWVLTQMSHLHLVNGDLRNAETLASGALQIFPGYHYGLGALAKVRTAQGKPAEAVALLEQRYKAAPHAENLFDLAEALRAAGRDSDAAAAYAEFERKATLESASTDNANRELIAYYADVANNPAKALEIAQLERARRHDIFTLDALAWALAANGDLAAASAEMKRALATGSKDPKLLHHATVIASAGGAASLHTRRTPSSGTRLRSPEVLD